MKNHFSSITRIHLNLKDNNKPSCGFFNENRFVVHLMYQNGKYNLYYSASFFMTSNFDYLMAIDFENKLSKSFKEKFKIKGPLLILSTL